MEIRDKNGRFVEKSKDLTGQRFFRLVAIRQIKKENDKHHAYWECKCDCGNRVVVRKDSLYSGHAKSCGCYSRDPSSKHRTHGLTKTKLYKAWHGMRQRCNNPKCDAYDRYGGRGIRVCKEWENSFETFRDWALNNGFNESLKGHSLSIDRIDVNGNYEPSNCRWVNSEVQNYNKAITVRVLIGGRQMTLKEISDEYQIPIKTVRSKYKRYRIGRITEGQLVEEIRHYGRVVCRNRR